MIYAHLSRYTEFYFGIRNAALISMKSTQEGFVYHQNYIFPNEGIPFKNQTLTMEIPHVPPGPYALRIDGWILCLFYLASDQGSKENGKNCGINANNPPFYEEATA